MEIGVIGAVIGNNGKPYGILRTNGHVEKDFGKAISKEIQEKGLYDREGNPIKNSITFSISKAKLDEETGELMYRIKCPILSNDYVWVFYNDLCDRHRLGYLKSYDFDKTNHRWVKETLKEKESGYELPIDNMWAANGIVNYRGTQGKFAGHELPIGVTTARWSRHAVFYVQGGNLHIISDGRLEPYMSDLKDVGSDTVALALTSILNGVDSIIIHEGTREILPEAFNMEKYGCVHRCNVQTVKLPDTLWTIGIRSFCGMTKLRVVSTLKADINTQAFKDCYSLEHIIIHRARVGGRAFENCVMLDRADLYGDTKAANTAFKGCSENLEIKKWR